MAILKEAIATFKKFDTYKEPSSINWFVWLIENPKSPISLAGAVDLYNHDIIHILLNRGMDVKDEAMVIGFTMGNSESSSGLSKWLFLLCARVLYPSGYRFSAEEVKEYNRGYSYGMTRRKRNIHLEKFNIDEEVLDIRRKFGINSLDIKDYPNLSTYG